MFKSSFHHFLFKSYTFEKVRNRLNRTAKSIIKVTSVSILCFHQLVLHRIVRLSRHIFGLDNNSLLHTMDNIGDCGMIR